MKKITIIAILALIFSVAVLNYAIADDYEDDEDDDDDEILFGDDGKFKDLGVLSLIFLGIGSLYILFRRIYVYSNKFLSEERYPEAKSFIKTNYHRFRQPIFIAHVYTSLLATLFALIHGIPFLVADLGMVLSGALAGLSMLLLSVSGFIMWRRQKPFWTNRESRKAIRWMHRQWLFTGLTLVGLIFHLIIVDD